MNHEFQRVDAALASSFIGRNLIFVENAFRAAWQTSASAGAVRSIATAWRSLPAIVVVRTVATAVTIAALLQPLLISVMPMAVAPAIPWPAFVMMALFAAVAAWRADAIVMAWPNSHLARRVRR